MSKYPPKPPRTEDAYQKWLMSLSAEEFAAHRAKVKEIVASHTKQKDAA
jgi:hypothetical protein